jgi:hypothetical protein
MLETLTNVQILHENWYGQCSCDVMDPSVVVKSHVDRSLLAVARWNCD